MYFVISNCDGDTIVTPYTKTKLLEMLSRNEEQKFITELSEEDANYWDGILIIKGEIVVPREKTRVVELDID